MGLPAPGRHATTRRSRSTTSACAAPSRLALDRYEGSKALSKITIVKESAASRCRARHTRRRPRSWRSWRATATTSRVARRGAAPPEGGGRPGRLLVHASRTAASRMPYEPLGIWLIDQWRQIGLNVKMEIIEAAALLQRPPARATSRSPSTSSAATSSSPTSTCSSSSRRTGRVNYGRYVDKMLDDLYKKQSAGRRPRGAEELVRDFEKRLLDEEAHYI